MYSHASLSPYNFVLRTLPLENGWVPPAPPIFKGKSPRDEVVLPKHLPHIDSTLH